MMTKVEMPYRLVPDVMATLWAAQDYVRFYALRDAHRKYRDLKVYEDGKGRQFFASMQVNVLPFCQKRIAFDPEYVVPEVAPAVLWVSHRDPVLNQTIYADSPQLTIGCRNPSGFGAVPQPGWQIELLCRGYGKHVRDYVESWLGKNAPVKYLEPGDA